jgi:dTDP-4-amino-4,6-dideoxygalactose transaminase
MAVPFFTGVREYQRKKDLFDAAMEEVLLRGDYILGQDVTALEEEVQGYLDVPYAIGLASGSDALLLGLHALGVGPGDEVVTSPFTFFASVSAITRLGAVPVFADIDPATFNLDPALAAEKVTSRTKAILPVHLFTQTADLSPLLSLAEENGLALLEDAAEAFGMSYREKKAGTLGDIGIYSFYPTKTLGAYGDAGMAVTRSEHLASRLRSLRRHGESRRYYHNEVGYNSRLDTLQAAILRVKLRSIDEDIRSRAAIASAYTTGLNNIKQVRLPVIKPHCDPVYYVYSLLTPFRDELKKYLDKKEIGNAIYYPLPLHLQECFSFLGYKEGDFPVAEETARSILALPIFPDMTPGETDEVITAVQSFFHSQG